MKLILAPMATLSHEAFRRAVAKFGGADEYFTEMINAASFLNRGPFEKFYVESGPEPEKIVWQITGSKKEPMAQAAGELADLDGIGVDINMGCSAPQIYNTGAGISWMLKDRAETQEMVRAVKSAVENAAKDGRPAKRLSVKLRLGDENFTREGFLDFCKMLVGEGVQMLTLHPRTKKEKYREAPRYEYVELLSNEFKIPVILNGDVKDAATFKKAKESAPHAEGIMIARAAAQKPWIFAELKGAESGKSEEKEIDCEKLALDFIEDVQKYQPPEFYKTRLQRFFAYYSMNFSFAHYFATQMVNSPSVEESVKRVREYFEKCPNDKIKCVRLCSR